MVHGPGQRGFARAVVLPRRRLLLGLNPEPPPPGERSGPRRGRANTRGRFPPRTGASVSRRPRRRARRLALSGRSWNSGRAHRDRWRQRRRRLDGGPDQSIARGGGRAARVRLAYLTLDRPHSFGRDAGEQGCRRPAHPQGLSEGAGRRIPSRKSGPEGSARLSALRRIDGLTARAGPGGIGGDAACRCNALRRGCRRRRCAGHAPDLAAYDPCLSHVERQAGAGS